MANEAEELTIDDLQMGDVILFEASEHCSSKAIESITRSNVAHSAMTFRSKAHVVEQMPPQVAITDTHKRLDGQGRKVHVMRPKFAATTDLSPVMDVAEGLFNDEEPYPYINLFTTINVSLMKAWMPRGILKVTMLRLMKQLTAHITNWANEYSFPGKHPMVCSQFIYFCFQQAGPQFDLDLDDTAHKRSGRSDNLGGHTDNSALILLDRVEGHFKAAGGDASGLGQIYPGGSFDDLDELCTSWMKWLHDWWYGKKHGLIRIDDVAELSEEVDDEFASVALAYINAVVQAGYFPLPSGAVDPTKPSEALKIFKENAALFVTPGDLLENCRNLQHIGVIQT